MKRLQRRQRKLKETNLPTRVSHFKILKKIIFILKKIIFIFKKFIFILKFYFPNFSMIDFSISKKFVIP